MTICKLWPGYTDLDLRTAKGKTVLLRLWPPSCGTSFHCTYKFVDTHYTFKKKLKTHLFRLAFIWFYLITLFQLLNLNFCILFCVVKHFMNFVHRVNKPYLLLQMGSKIIDPNMLKPAFLLCDTQESSLAIFGLVG